MQFYKKKKWDAKQQNAMKRQLKLKVSSLQGTSLPTIQMILQYK